VAFYPILRGVAQLIANRRSDREEPGVVARVLSSPALSALLAVLLLAPPLVLASYVAHAAFGGGAWDALPRGLALTGAALVLSGVLAVPWAIMFVNRSSLQSTYDARLARTFLGASNPNERGAPGDDVRPGDDVDSLPQYRPFEAGGPLHLIGVCVNQTVDVETLRSYRARMGTILACSPIGLSIGQWSHALWVARPREGKRAKELGPVRTIEAVSHVPGTPHPLLGIDGTPPEELDVLPLRDWVSISGAAFGPGMGAFTNPALSVLFTLANLRTGYWWNSRLTSGQRGTRPRVSFVRRVLWLLPKLFETQSRLLSEALARFTGPWERFWYLSDGGHFENLGGYELVRRHVPFIIMIDAGADPNYDFADFANFERKVRIDFGAEVQPFGKDEWQAAIDAIAGKPAPGAPAGATDPARKAWDAIASHVAVDRDEGGPLDGLVDLSETSRQGPIVKKHAALFRVVYPNERDRQSILLYVKASLSGDEPADVQNYRRRNEDFPHESTADQSFDESQWESYRRLGKHVGDMVLGAEMDSGRTPEGIWLKKVPPPHG
jgi:hypothetical protein